MPNQSADNEGQLRAGHPPAVKVGNMRVVQRTHSSSSSSSDKNDDDHAESAPVPSACSFAPKTVVKPATGGVPDNTAQSVPEAVKQFHDKPQATHEYRGHSAKPNVIMQPKK